MRSWFWLTQKCTRWRISVHLILQRLVIGLNMVVGPIIFPMAHVLIRLPHLSPRLVNVVKKFFETVSDVVVNAVFYCVLHYTDPHGMNRFHSARIGQQWHTSYLSDDRLQRSFEIWVFLIFVQTLYFFPQTCPLCSAYYCLQLQGENAHKKLSTNERYIDNVKSTPFKTGSMACVK